MGWPLYPPWTYNARILYDEDTRNSNNNRRVVTIRVVDLNRVTRFFIIIIIHRSHTNSIQLISLDTL